MSRTCCFQKQTVTRAGCTIQQQLCVLNEIGQRQQQNICKLSSKTANEKTSSSSAYVYIYIYMLFNPLSVLFSYILQPEAQPVYIRC